MLPRSQPRVLAAPSCTDRLVDIERVRVRHVHNVIEIPNLGREAFQVVEPRSVPEDGLVVHHRHLGRLALLVFDRIILYYSGIEPRPLSTQTMPHALLLALLPEIVVMRGSLHTVGKTTGGELHDFPHCGKWRCIRQVNCCKIIDARLVPQGSCDRIDTFS